MEELKKKIIIDTNIFYNISKEEIVKLKKDYELIVPMIVLNEIYTSPNLFISKETFNSIKTAINNIFYNVENLKFIELNPFEFMLKEVYSNVKPYSKLDFYLNEFNSIISLDYKIVKNNYVNRFDISQLTNFINETSLNYKKEISPNKNKFKKFDTLDLTKSLILKYSNDNLEKLNELYPKITELSSTKFELLVTTFDFLLREVSKSGKKIKNNDWVDIFILTFVETDDLFWTREESKLQLIEDVGLEKYLYRHNDHDK